jgi:hypothetical protein
LEPALAAREGKESFSILDFGFWILDWMVLFRSGRTSVLGRPALNGIAGAGLISPFILHDSVVLASSRGFDSLYQ